jgi:histidine triad (HIT) family protein
MDNVNYNCIFCAIAARRAPASIVYENDGALAFLDLNTVPEAHTLVVPKKHSRNLFDFDDASALAVLRASRIVARAIRAALNAEGMTMLLASEHVAGQEVFHSHFHLMPRWGDDGLSRGGRPIEGRTVRKGGTSRAELDALAEKIRAHIQDA